MELQLCFLYEKEVLSTAEWVQEEIETRRLLPIIAGTSSLVSIDSTSQFSSSTADAHGHENLVDAEWLNAVQEICKKQQYSRTPIVESPVENSSKNGPSCVLTSSSEKEGNPCLFVLIFSDAFSPSSKDIYATMKRVLVELPSDAAAIHVLNTKKGVAFAEWKKNPLLVEKALLRTIGNVWPNILNGKSDTLLESKSTHSDPHELPEISTSKKKQEVGEVPLANQLSLLLDEHDGETLYPVTADTVESLERRCQKLHEASTSLSICCVLLSCSPSAVEASDKIQDLFAPAWAPSIFPAQKNIVETTPLEAVFLLRRTPSVIEDVVDLRLAMCGNVDSGKSTLTAVLTRGCKDDGRGFARSFVLRHRHEQATGKTSSITEHYLGFTTNGSVVNYASGIDNEGGCVGTSNTASNTAHNAVEKPLDSNKKGDNNGPTSEEYLRRYRPQELAKQSAKIVTIYDLAGHEKYLKTTVLGMTRKLPDYACVVISANNGIQRMTKEHLILCLALKIPFFIIVTRIDAVPAVVKSETMASISKMIKSKVVQRKPFLVKNLRDVLLAAKCLGDFSLVPILELSNVTSEGLPLLTQLLNVLQRRYSWSGVRTQKKEMIIDNVYAVPGVGTVVGGIVTQGSFHPNDVVFLGPDGTGQFRSTTIKSIHVRGVLVPQVQAGNDAAFCLKKEKRSLIRRGNVLVASAPKVYWEFDAEITILYHATTIACHYEPVIHASTVTQSARITSVDKPDQLLRTGDHATVSFHFLYRPEYIKEGQRILFREGRTKGIGTITQRREERNLPSLGYSKAFWKRQSAATLPASHGGAKVGAKQ